MKIIAYLTGIDHHYILRQLLIQCIRSANSQAQTTVRTIYDCTVSKVGDIITIRVTGNGFLYNMVRIIAGTLVKIGGSDMPADAMKGIIAATDRAAAAPTAPAHGLTMIGLKYE